MSDHIFVRWTEETSEFDYWQYVGNGETRPVFKTGTRTVVLHYTSEVNEEMVNRAKAYAEEKRQAGFRGVEVYVTDWESRHNV